MSGLPMNSWTRCSAPGFLQLRHVKVGFVGVPAGDDAGWVLGGIPDILALIFEIIGMHRAAMLGGLGQGMAITGLVLSCVSLSRYFSAQEASGSNSEQGRVLSPSMPDMEPWTTGRLLSTAARLVVHAWNGKLRGLGLTRSN